MGQRYVQARCAHCGCELQGFTVQMQFRFSGRKLLHLNVFPFHTCGPTGSQCLKPRLLCGEPGGVVNHRISALRTVINFRLRIYSIEKARTKLLNGFANAVVLNYVDANAKNHALMLQVKRVSQITLLHSPLLDRIPGVFHAFSTRRAEHSELSLGPTSSDNPMIAINRSRFLAAAGVPGWPVLKLNQVHSATVHDMTDTWASNEPRTGDAAITAVRGALLAIQTADCVPILMADRRGQLAAAVHAGWRGTAGHIAQRTVEAIQEKYGIAPSDLVAAIGPHNAVCCYEVGEDVVNAVQDAESFTFRPEWNKPHFNQALANRKQLLAAGIPEEQIAVSTLCTQCRADLFYSYRRDRSRTGRMLSVIGLTP